LMPFWNLVLPGSGVLRGVVWVVQTLPPPEIPNYSCFQNPWLGGHCPQIPVLCVLSWICWTPSPQTKFLVRHCCQSVQRNVFETQQINWIQSGLLKWPIKWSQQYGQTVKLMWGLKYGERFCWRFKFSGNVRTCWLVSGYTHQDQAFWQSKEAAWPSRWRWCYLLNCQFVFTSRHGLTSQKTWIRNWCFVKHFVLQVLFFRQFN
jgi:hypothetical protein